MKGKKISLLSVPILLLIAAVTIVGVGYFRSQTLEVEEERFSVGLSEPLTVAHLSDLHLPKVGVPTDTILKALKNRSPDFVFLTGDVFDASMTETSLSTYRAFFLALSDVAPVYAVIGNHEIGSPLYERYRAYAKSVNMTLLENRSVILRHGSDDILLCGVKDGALPTTKNLKKTDLPDDKYKLTFLLAHRPENFSYYVEAGFMYSFCGHAHGGQARLFGQGLYAPDQGYFPSYTSGVYEKEESVMLVSRGLGDGNSRFRIFNPYHMLFATFS
ncbi:MAG: metallophosphoesterase [Clostridia bacterium]|nr:metallophosphoesterase [Clostridia bacterium]